MSAESKAFYDQLLDPDILNVGDVLGLWTGARPPYHKLNYRVLNICRDQYIELGLVDPSPNNERLKRLSDIKLFHKQKRAKRKRSDDHNVNAEPDPIDDPTLEQAVVRNHLEEVHQTQGIEYVYKFVVKAGSSVQFSPCLVLQTQMFATYDDTKPIVPEHAFSFPVRVNVLEFFGTKSPYYVDSSSSLANINLSAILSYETKDRVPVPESYSLVGNKISHDVVSLFACNSVNQLVHEARVVQFLTCGGVINEISPPFPLKKIQLCGNVVAGVAYRDYKIWTYDLESGVERNFEWPVEVFKHQPEVDYSAPYYKADLFYVRFTSLTSTDENGLMYITLRTNIIASWTLGSDAPPKQLMFAPGTSMKKNDCWSLCALNRSRLLVGNSEYDVVDNEHLVPTGFSFRVNGKDNLLSSARLFQTASSGELLVLCYEKAGCIDMFRQNDQGDFRILVKNFKVDTPYDTFVDHLERLFVLVDGGKCIECWGQIADVLQK